MDYDERRSAAPRGGPMRRVRYKNLVQDTEQTVRRVCDFLDEILEPQMLSWEQNATVIVAGCEMPVPGKLGLRPMISDIDRWRCEMSGRGLLVCETFVGRHLGRIGCDRAFAGPSWPPALALSRWYCRYLPPVLGLPVRTLRETRRWRRDAA